MLLKTILKCFLPKSKPIDEAEKTDKPEKAEKSGKDKKDDGSRSNI